MWQRGVSRSCHEAIEGGGSVAAEDPDLLTSSYDPKNEVFLFYFLYFF